MTAPQQFVTDSERERALRIALNPMAAPVTLDSLCLLSLALRDAEARWAFLQSEVSTLVEEASEKGFIEGQHNIQESRQ